MKFNFNYKQTDRQKEEYSVQNESEWIHRYREVESMMVSRFSSESQRQPTVKKEIN